MTEILSRPQLPFYVKCMLALGLALGFAAIAVLVVQSYHEVPISSWLETAVCAGLLAGVASALVSMSVWWDNRRQAKALPSEA